MKLEKKPQVQLFIIHRGDDTCYANTFGEALEAAAAMYQRHVERVIEIAEESDEEYDVQLVIDTVKIQIDALICTYTGSETRTTHSII
jgi:hypothetical protein